jgi:hypothetical protein
MQRKTFASFIQSISVAVCQDVIKKFQYSIIVEIFF